LEHTKADSSALALFRILFGCLLTNYFWKLYSSDWIHFNYEVAQIALKYDFLPWLTVAASSLRLILVVLLIASVFFTLGLVYRLSSLILVLVFTYIYLLDPCWYGIEITFPRSQTLSVPRLYD